MTVYTREEYYICIDLDSHDYDDKISEMLDENGINDYEFTDSDGELQIFVDCFDEEYEAEDIEEKIHNILCG